MEIRDAIEADAERLAALTGAPADVMRNLVHDRTVRVAAEGDEVPHHVRGSARQVRQPLGVGLDGVPYLHASAYRAQSD